jgi:hypothetical protein
VASGEFEAQRFLYPLLAQVDVVGLQLVPFVSQLGQPAPPHRG